MGLFDSLVLRADGGFASYPPDHDYWYTERSAPTPSGVPVDSETAQKLSAWYRGRKLLATAVAMSPLDVFERLADEKGAVKAREHPLYDVLHRKPNAWMDSYAYRRMKMFHLIDDGNGYDVIRSGRRGFVDELWPLDPKRMAVEQLPSRRLLYHYRQPKTNDVMTYSQEEIFHLRGASSDGIVGKGILAYARESIGLGRAVESYASQIFGKGTLSGGYIKTPGKLAEDVAKRMAERFVTKPGQWGMPKVLEQGSEFTESKMSPEDFQMIDSRSTSVDDMARWLGIPRMMLENSDPSFGNAEQFNQNFETFSIGEWFSLWEFACNDQLVIAPKKYYVEFNRDAFRRSSYLERWQGHQIAVSTGTKTRNEVRRTENLNALPGLDKPLDPAHLTGKQEPTGDEEKDRPKDRPTQTAPAKDDDAKALNEIAVESSRRLLRKEIKAVSALCVKHAKRGDVFAAAITEFYASHARLVSDTLCMSVADAEAYCAGQASQAIEHGANVIKTWETDQYARGLAQWALEAAA